MVEVGQKFLVLPAFIAKQPACIGEKQQEGTVIHVHERHGWALLEFDGVTGKPREGFKLDVLEQAAAPRSKKRKKK